MHSELVTIFSSSEGIDWTYCSIDCSQLFLPDVPSVHFSKGDHSLLSQQHIKPFWLFEFYTYDAASRRRWLELNHSFNRPQKKVKSNGRAKFIYFLAINHNILRVNKISIKFNSTIHSINLKNYNILTKWKTAS